MTHCRQFASVEAEYDCKRISKLRCSMAELERLISSVYEDKVRDKIAENICVNLLNHYQDEKTRKKAGAIGA